MNFIDQVTCGPGIDPRDEDSARVGLERWCEAAETLDDGGAAARAMVAEGLAATCCAAFSPIAPISRRSACASKRP